MKLTAIAHGGWSVGRIDGRVVFVRGGVPGEDVLVELVDTSRKKFWRGEVREVLLASPHRVSPPCPIANECGGCDFQHISSNHQLELKRQVIAEQLLRLAGIEWDGVVEPVGSSSGWRTRMRYHNEDGVIGLRAARSHRVVQLPQNGCAIAHPDGKGLELGVNASEVLVTVADSGVSINGDPEVVKQQVFDRIFSVSATGFWQVHPGAASTLVASVLDLGRVQPGQQALDLYCGVGLFSGFLVDAGAQVTGIEGNRKAVEQARQNVPQAKFHCGDVAAALRGIRPKADLVVLDPPRAGAGAEVIRLVAKADPQTMIYVACDPASLARDLNTCQGLGYRVEQIKAFDLFPMTHHVETVAALRRMPG